MDYSAFGKRLQLRKRWRRDGRGDGHAAAQIFHPVDAYITEDKQAFSERITSLYAQITIPKIYVVALFMPVPADSCFVGGDSHPKFVRFKIDQIARTLPDATLRGWWMRRIEEIIAPYVRERGFEWEVQIGELPSDL